MKKELTFFDKKENVQRFLKVFFASLVVLLIVDFFIPKHADFYWEEAPGFFAAFGYISCVGLIYLARIIRFFIKRGEDYYDR